MKRKFSPYPKPNPDPKPKPDGHKPRFKTPIGYIRRNFTITHSDFSIIQKVAAEKGLGQRGNSAALRIILREWNHYDNQLHRPVVISLPPEMISDQHIPDDE